MVSAKPENPMIEEVDTSFQQAFEARLLASLREQQPQSNNTSFVLSASKPLAEIVGGLTASTSYGWLCIKTLWVDKTCRGAGVGRALMQAAERKALRTGCHGAWLDTSNPDAMAFYGRLGYKAFGLIGNDADQYPPNHKRWFMKRTLAPSNVGEQGVG